jgi:Ca2+-binding EF-hand superfamily protein
MELLKPETLSSLGLVFKSFASTLHGEDVIGPADLLAVLRSLGVSTATEGEAHDLISLVDTAGRGALSFEQFCTLLVTADLRDGDTEAECQEAFAWADSATRDGHLSAEDVRGAIAAAASESKGTGMEHQADMPIDVAQGVVSDIIGPEFARAAPVATYSDFATFLQAQYALHA